jgi:uncharacterized membrane protein YbaN (DUF454 family)
MVSIITVCVCALYTCRQQENCIQVQRLATKFLKLQILKSNVQTWQNTECLSRASHKDQGVLGLVMLYCIILLTIAKVIYDIVLVITPLYLL